MVDSTTLGDLLRQDGALALLAIGAVVGFFAGMFFREIKGKAASALRARAYGSAGGVPAAVIAAITAAVNIYQSENP